MESIWYIHGAYASSQSFRRISEHLPEHHQTFVRYDIHAPLEQSIAELSAQASASSDSISIVGHSLGGIIAVAMAQGGANIKRVITMAAPFGGSRAADILRWWCPSQLHEDIRPQSAILRRVRAARLCAPVLCLVATGGHNLMIDEPNDGVISVRSQLALNGPTFVRLPFNHYEILLADESIRLIEDFSLRVVKKS